MRHQPTEYRPGAAPPLGREYDLEGRRLWLHRSGSGGPSVVFLPGAGLVGLGFLNIHDRAAELTASVLYDRAGTGWSEHVTLPRTPTEVTDELRHGGDLPDVPLIVLTAGGDNPYWAQFMPEHLMREAHEGVRAMQAAIAASVPQGEQRVLTGASHQYGHVEQPDAVFHAIRDLLGKADARR